MSEFCQGADGMVYFIDAADSGRFEESRVELNVGMCYYCMCTNILFCVVQKLLSDEKIAHKPILILGNKIDRPNAVREEDIKTAFHLHDNITGKVHTTQQ